MRAWLRGWVKTLHIKYFDRETYRVLRDARFEPGDFVEVPRP